jgi:hypothetical protein
VRELNEKDLNKHLRLLDAASDEDRDELLRDLLVHVYPTKTAQDA